MTEQMVYFYPNGIISKIYTRASESVMEFYEDGRLFKSYALKNNVMSGAYRSYFRNGLYNETYQLEDGKKYGVYCSYYENGHTKEYSYYFMNQLHGSCLTYTHSGVLYTHEQFERGKSCGPKYIYYDNSRVKYIIRYESENRDSGLMEYYNENQNLLTVHTFKNFKRHGRFLKYDVNGLVIERTYFKNGNLHGQCKKFDTNGNVILRGYFRNGKKNGIFSETNHHTFQKTRFRNDNRHGLHYLVDKNTHEKIISLFYNNGKFNGIQHLHYKNKKYFYRENYLMLENVLVNDTCSVCWNKSYWKTPCSHFLCVSCASKLQRLHCPLCREPFLQNTSIITGM
jgi:antitoxin component YwqK of YwqJK toxin-antitoxin module